MKWALNGGISRFKEREVFVSVCVTSSATVFLGLLQENIYDSTIFLIVICTTLHYTLWHWTSDHLLANRVGLCREKLFLYESSYIRWFKNDFSAFIFLFFAPKSLKCCLFHISTTNASPQKKTKRDIIRPIFTKRNLNRFGIENCQQMKLQAVVYLPHEHYLQFNQKIKQNFYWTSHKLCDSKIVCNAETMSNSFLLHFHAEYIYLGNKFMRHLSLKIIGAYH